MLWKKGICRSLTIKFYDFKKDQKWNKILELVSLIFDLPIIDISMMWIN